MIIMVRRIIIQIFFMLLCAAVPVLAQDCYNFTRTQAISFYEKGEYRIARDQFVAAKDCPDKPADNDLDSWIDKCDSAIAEMERKTEAERQRRAEEERIKAEERKKEEQARLAEEERLRKEEQQRKEQERLAAEKRMEEERREQEIRDSLAKYRLTEVRMVMHPLGIMTDKEETLQTLVREFGIVPEEYHGRITFKYPPSYTYKGLSPSLVIASFYNDELSDFEYRFIFRKSQYSHQDIETMANDFISELSRTKPEKWKLTFERMEIKKAAKTKTINTESKVRVKLYYPIDYRNINIYVSFGELTVDKKYDSWFFYVDCFTY